MFIQTESTPNPATLKFIPGCTVLEQGAADFPNLASATASPLASRLFDVPEVTGVYLGADFITVTKSNGEWHHLKPMILGAIMEHFTSGRPVMLAEGAAAAGGHARDIDCDDEEIVAQIIELLDTKVRPAVAQDGGDIVFRSFSEGVVYVHLQGSCAGCPSSTMTLKNGIENMLKHYIPEVEEVRQVG
ncbi:MAG: NifU family protein [Alphaproteobacteria bacterium]